MLAYRVVFFGWIGLWALCVVSWAEAAPEKEAFVDNTRLLAESPFLEAELTYSREPEKTLLFISSHSTYGSRRHHTVHLFGDGRLVFRKLIGKEVLEEQKVVVSESDIQRILRMVVDFGLAEWDLTRVQAKQVEKNGGKLYGAVPSDAVSTLMLISLESYRRGEYQVEGLERKVRFHGAAFADDFYPPILEIRGIVEVKKELYRLKGEGIEPMPTSRPSSSPLRTPQTKRSVLVSRKSSRSIRTTRSTIA